MLGVAQGAIDAVIPYLSERKQFGRSIGEFQVYCNHKIILFDVICSAGNATLESSASY